MQFYAEAESIHPDDMAVFEKVRCTISVLPDIIFDPADTSFGRCKNQYTCHLICRALAYHFELYACDGYFTVGCRHSWLMTKSGSSIIDAYPAAGASPFIVANDHMSPWSRLYNKSDNFSSEFLSDVFLERLDEAIRVVRTVKGQLGYH